MDSPSHITRRKRPLWWWIATWFGVGEAKFASGTMGSLAALPYAFILQYYWGSTVLFFAAIAMFAVGTWASDKFIRQMGKGEDPGEIVVDEVAGQWLVLSVLFPTWQSYLVGFFLFRVFDVVKPWPVSLADRKVHGGIGVMFDDFLAACYPIVVYLIIMIESQLLDGQKLLNPVIGFLAGHV